MSNQLPEALRKALDEMERLRRRGLAITRFLLAASIVFLVISIAVFLLRGNVALGMTYSLITLYALISACAINLTGTSSANTQRILKAIEALSRERAGE